MFIPPFFLIRQKSGPALKKARKEDSNCDGLVNGTVREEQGEGGEGQEEKGNSTIENEQISSEVITDHVQLTTAHPTSLLPSLLATKEMYGLSSIHGRPIIQSVPWGP